MQEINIAITGWGSVSPLGANQEEIWQAYLEGQHCFTKAIFNAATEWVAPLCAPGKTITALIGRDARYKQLDPAVWYAIAASRRAVKQAGWVAGVDFGVNIASSRGATTTFEKHHSKYIQSGSQALDVNTSPSTTLGNIACWTAADLGAAGPVISHSITCSSALHAVLNAVAWLQAGLCTHFLAGGSEAPLTAFTLAQMRALRIYSSLHTEYPCLAMDTTKKQNTMVLGEGAVSFCLQAVADKSLAYITGIGHGTEGISHGASLSAEAICLQKSMTMALGKHSPESVDAIVLHAPGTIKGDMAELRAIDKVFGDHKPLLTSNKWQVGHAFGASGALSIEMALLMLQHNQFIQPPYLRQQEQCGPLKNIMVNAIGFGGNAVSILLSV
jgi:3-oxoacyl-(acyl-carrier-protein) synthase